MIKNFKHYLELMRLHQPIGIFLLLWPCLISLNLATNGNPPKFLIALFTVGSILMRSAGCVFNDIVDKNFDKEVARTQNRPITIGKISIKNALKFLVFLLVLSLLLLFFLPEKAVILSFCSVPLIALYPFCKRFTYWPQVCLGITFNLGALVAWSAINPYLSLPIILLYVGFIFWTLGYDTIYAHQDKEDDLKLGLKSTAIILGEKTPKYLNFFYTISITLIIFAFGLVSSSMNFYLLMIPPIFLLFWQVSTIKINDPANCRRRFKANMYVGGLIFVASMFMGIK